MASMIKSGIFFRHLTGLTRNLVLNSHRSSDANLIRFSRLSCAALTNSRGFASAIERPALKLDESIRKLDESIRKLDQDVRRVGRISRRDVEEVFNEIRWTKTATSSQSLLLIRCCGNVLPEELPEARTALAQKIWKTLNELNVSMDISHYNALLRVYLENEHPFSPTEFLADLESKGIEANRVTYQRLISRYCQQGDIDGATKILECMREKNHPINENVFSSLIMGHSEAGDLEAAIGILPVMKKAGMEPTPDTYANLLCSYAKYGKIDEILSTLDTCESTEIYLTDKHLLEVIYHLAKNGHIDFVDKVISHLRKSSGFNQLASNLILRLVNNGHEDVALKILKSMPRGTKPTGELYEIGSFFIKQLIKSGRPTEKILSICNELEASGLHSRAKTLAVEMAARSGNIDIALPFFAELKRNGLPVRQHYFWPLLCAAGKTGTAALLDVLRVMQSEFDMSPNGETIRDYVVPNVQERDYDKIILTLRTTGVSSAAAILGCVHHALTNNRLKAAVTLISSYEIYYQPGILRRPLIEALIRTNDFESYQHIVRGVYESIPRLQKIQNSSAVDEEQQQGDDKQTEVVGQFVLDAVTHFGGKRVEATEKILSALVEQGLSMSRDYAERIQKRLGSSLTPEISTLLEKLTAGDLDPIPYESRSRAIKFDFSDMPVGNLEKMIQQKEAQGENVKGLKRALLQAYYKAKDVQKYEELIGELSTSDFVLTSGLYSQRIELLASNNEIDKALAVYTEYKSKEPDFVLDDFKKIKLVHAFVANDRIDEAVEFLKSNKRDEKSADERSITYSRTCWDILNLLAEKGRDADLTKVFNALEESNLIEVSNTLLGPLVKVHLVNDDITNALKSFEMLSTKYKCTPLKNELSCKIIRSEDGPRLQLVTDLATNVHGEANCLHDLVSSFIETGRIQLARKILETPGLPGRPQRINDAAKRYCREGNTAVLEGLVEVTKDFNYIDRQEIFYQLLLSYCKEESTEKALDLWTKIQEEENVAASDKFLVKLANYLREKGVKVPFVVPESSDRKTSNRKSSPQSTNKPRVSKDDNLEKMVQQNRLDDATELVMKMVNANTYPEDSKFRYYLNKIAKDGKYEVYEKLSSLLPTDVKQKLSFNNRRSNAYIAAGKSELLLDETIKNFDNATTEAELKGLESTFPKGGMCGILRSNPELLPKFEKFATSAAERGFYAPINVLWMNFVENGKLDQADRIMKTYLADQPKIIFQNPLRVARARRDETIVLNVLKALADSKIAESHRGVVYSCLIDVYCLQGKYDKALEAVDLSIKDVCLENINRSALQTLKSGLEAAGKTFPHKIPDNKKVNAADSSSSSSSSSDDESAVKK